MWPHSGGATRCLCDALVRLGHRLASAASVARRSLAASSMRLSCHLTRHGHAELAANPPLGPLTHRQAHLEWPCSCSASSLTRRASATFISVLAIRWFSLLFRANPFSRAGCFRNQIWMSAEGVATRSVEAKRSICDESLPPHGLCVLSPCSVGRPPCALGRQWRGLLRCALSIEAMAFVNQSKRDGQPLSPRCSGGRRRWHPFFDASAQ